MTAVSFTGDTTNEVSLPFSSDPPRLNSSKALSGLQSELLREEVPPSPDKLPAVLLPHDMSIGHRGAAQMVVASGGWWLVKVALAGWLGGWLVLLLLQRPTGQGGHGGCFWWHFWKRRERLFVTVTGPGFSADIFFDGAVKIIFVGFDGGQFF